MQFSSNLENLLPIPSYFYFPFFFENRMCTWYDQIIWLTKAAGCYPMERQEFVIGEAEDQTSVQAYNKFQLIMCNQYILNYGWEKACFRVGCESYIRKNQHISMEFYQFYWCVWSSWYWYWLLTSLEICKLSVYPGALELTFYITRAYKSVSEMKCVKNGLQNRQINSCLIMIMSHGSQHFRYRNFCQFKIS